MAGVAGYVRDRAIRTNQYFLRRCWYLDEVLNLERAEIEDRNFLCAGQGNQ